MSKSLDNFGRILTTMVAVTVTILVAVYALTNENYRLMGLMLAAAPMVALVNNPPMFAVVIIGLSQSNLILPGLPQGLVLADLLMAGFCALVVARNIVAKPSRQKSPLSFKLLWAFIFLLAFIISQRGFGLLMSGGSTVGGSAYIKFMIYASFMFCMRYVVLTTRQWKMAIVLLFLGGLLPVFSEALFVASGGAITAQFALVKPYIFGLTDTMNAIETGTHTVRFTSLAPVAMNLMVATLLFTTSRRKFKPLTYAMLAVCLIAAGLTGFRSVIGEILVVSFMYRLMIAPKNLRSQIVVFTAVAAVLAFIVMIPLIQVLPLSIQRSFSWLPFVDVDTVALDDARGTMAWRFEFWRFCLDRADEFLWIGRGITVNTDDLFAYSVIKDPMLNPWFGHAYHNGPIGLLIDSGIPGLVIGLLFLFFSAREAATDRTTISDDFTFSFYTFIRAKIIFQCLAYVFIIGSIDSTLPYIFLLMGIFYGLKVTDTGSAHSRVKRDFSIVDPTFGSSSAKRDSRF